MVPCHEELRNVGTGTHTQIRAVHPLVERNQVQKGSESRSGGDTNVNLLMAVELTLPGVQAFRISVEGRPNAECAHPFSGAEKSEDNSPTEAHTSSGRCPRPQLPTPRQHLVMQSEARTRACPGGGAACAP